MKLAIYSTFCGPTKAATFCQKAHAIYPSYFISNNMDVLMAAQAKGWIPIHISDQPVVEDPVVSAMQSKIAKALPHLFEDLMQYDYLFYIDDKYAINEALVPELVAKLKESNAPLAMKRHPFLDSNVLSEYTESLKQPRYWAQRQQMSAYIAKQVEDGLPLLADIHYATGCILRDMHHPDIEKIDQLWFDHIVQCGIECQVSFFFIARQFPNIMVLPTNVFE
jgi:hypothetical protein